MRLLESMHKFVSQLMAIYGPPQIRYLVVSNHLLSTKNVVCEMSCRQLNAKILVVDTKQFPSWERETSLVVDNNGNMTHI